MVKSAQDLAMKENVHRRKLGEIISLAYVKR